LGCLLFGLIFLVRGLDGVKDVLRPMLEWKRSPLLYLFAIVWTAGLCLFVLFVKRFQTGDQLAIVEVTSGLLVLVMQVVFSASILVFPITPAVGGVATYWAFAVTYFLACKHAVSLLRSQTTAVYPKTGHRNQSRGTGLIPRKQMGN